MDIEALTEINERLAGLVLDGTVISSTLHKPFTGTNKNGKEWERYDLQLKVVSNPDFDSIVKDLLALCEGGKSLTILDNGVISFSSFDRDFFDIVDTDLDEELKQGTQLKVITQFRYSKGKDGVGIEADYISGKVIKLVKRLSIRDFANA